jgi:hypothetical protein
MLTRELFDRQSFLMAAAAILAICGFVLSASSAQAATWTIQTTPNASGAEHSALYDIACEGSTTNACFSVGKQTASGGTSGPYVQLWNGSSWANQTAVAPEGSSAGELQSVDCFPKLILEKLFCFAAGSYTSGGVTNPLVENSTVGGAWKLNTTPSPEGASETAFKGISCRQTISSCIAVGYSVKGGVKSAFVEGMTSEAKWVIQTMPVPEGAVTSELHGIDCASSTFCMAVGSYTLAGGAQWAMSATWNGTSWTSRTVAKPTESKGSILLDVSCESTSSCTGVGAYKNSKNVQVSFVERWNGTAWSYQSSPNPTGSTNTVFQGVSCVSSTPCVAVGDWYNGKSWQPMAQEWNGSAWALDTTPTPAEATFSLLEGVACRTACLAPGWYTDSGGKNKTLSETR